MSDPFNQAIATGRAYVDYDPLTVLKELRAAIGYCNGYIISLGKDQNAYLFRRLADTISFHTGGARCCAERGSKSMSDQPKALRLADELLDGMTDEHWNQLNADAAAELRGLYAERAALREQNFEMMRALSDLAAWDDGEVGPHMDEPHAANVARAVMAKVQAALAKVEGEV